LAAGIGYWVGAVAVTVLAVVALLLERPLSGITHRIGTARGLVVHLAPGAEPVSTLDLAMAIAGARALKIAVDRRGGDDHATVSIDLVDLPGEMATKLTNDERSSRRHSVEPGDDVGDRAAGPWATPRPRAGGGGRPFPPRRFYPSPTGDRHDLGD
jgi:hypothetical protein